MGRRQDNTTRLSSKTLVETAREKGAGGRGEQYWEAGGFQALIYPVF